MSTSRMWVVVRPQQQSRYYEFNCSTDFMEAKKKGV